MRWLLCILYLFIGAVVFALPNMTRRGMLFAVPVPANFRESSQARHAIATFRTLVAAVVAATVCALLLSPDSVLEAVVVASPLGIVLAGGLGFFWERSKLMSFAVQPSAPREAEVTNAPDRVPGFTWLAAGPFAILAGAAVFLRQNWERIPSRFPIHWGIDGQPNGWNERTTHGVYGPLLFAAELCGWLLIMGLATWFGARRLRFRRIVLGVMIAAEYMLAFVFATISIEPVLHIPIWITTLATMVFIIPTLIVMWRNVSGATAAPVEATPDQGWEGGVLYYNPNDAALFVEKRIGLGYTLNFGNRWSWVLLLGLAVILASAFALL